MKQRTLVCIPTYNEKENILAFISKVFSYEKDFHILVIDDASPDGTARLIEESPLFQKKIFLIKRSGPRGLGKSYLDGFKWAIDHNYTFVFQCDADFSHDPKYMRSFLDELERGSDLVIGSRNIPGGGIENWSYFRKFISKFGSLYGRVILGIKIQDLTGGFNVYKVDSLKKLTLKAIKSNGYVFQIELKYRATLRKFLITEIPITFKDRVLGESKMDLKIILEAFWHVIYLKFLCKEKA